MLGLKRLVIAQHQRGLRYKNGKLIDVLEPGVYWLFDLLKRQAIEVYDLTQVEFTHPRIDMLMQDNAALLADFVQTVDLGERELGLIYLKGKLTSVLAPGSRKFYWKGALDVQARKVDLTTGYAVEPSIVALLQQPLTSTLTKELAAAIVFKEVPNHSVGLLIVGGELVATLKAGVYAYWKFQRSITLELVDTRLQPAEVSGQEILTKDKVSLRVNLSASYRVIDAVAAKTTVTDYKDALYRELQYGLRQAVGARTLDTLLGNKGELDASVLAYARDKVSGFGIEIASVGVKDVILPGEMKTILNQVVEAEKQAQANLIKRREETAATRSLLNTAKLMEDNPILLRMKELESLEKVTEKIDKLTVFGGLDGVLKDLVTLGRKA